MLPNVKAEILIAVLQFPHSITKILLTLSVKTQLLPSPMLTNPEIPREVSIANAEENRFFLCVDIYC